VMYRLRIAEEQKGADDFFVKIHAKTAQLGA
jgi:hypothetical protein